MKIKKLLMKKIPEGKNFNKNMKFIEFLPIAISFWSDGFDFEIKYQEEKGHFEKVKDEIIETTNTPDGMEGFGGNTVTYRFKSGKEYTYYDKEANWNPDFRLPNFDEQYFEEYIIDQEEKISIVKGSRLLK